MKPEYLKISKISWIITACLAFVAALGGILNRDIYQGLFPPEFLPGAWYQDVLTVLVCIVVIGLAVTSKPEDVKKQIVIIGLVGSLFYLYGIFTIERVYNWYYLVYAAVFAVSFWSLAYSVSRYRNDGFAGLQIGGGILKVAAMSSIVIALVFTFLWTTALIPFMRENNRIEYLYSIYILDLCFIMPAFSIAAIMGLRRNAFGILMMPALMILGFFVIFPLGLNELAKPSAGMEIMYGPMVVSFAFAAYMLVIATLHLKKMRL